MSGNHLAVWVTLALLSFHQLSILQNTDCSELLTENVEAHSLTVSNVINIAQVAQFNNLSGDYRIASSGSVIVSELNDGRLSGIDALLLPVSLIERLTSASLVSVSLDNTLLAFVDSESSIIELWDVSDQRFLDRINTEKDQITALAFDPNGQKLAWAGSDSGQIEGDPWIGDSTIAVYDLQKRRTNHSLSNAADVITMLEFINQGMRIIFRGSFPGYESYNIQIWDYEHGKQHVLSEAWFLTFAYMNNDDMLIVAAKYSLGISNEFSYRLEKWDLKNNTMSMSIDVTNPILTLAVNSTATLIVSGDNVGTIAFIQGAEFDIIHTLNAYSGQINTLSFSSDDDVIISSGIDNNDLVECVRIWAVIGE